jgi:hypothetical protein
MSQSTLPLRGESFAFVARNVAMIKVIEALPLLLTLQTKMKPRPKDGRSARDQIWPGRVHVVKVVKV